MTSHSIRVSDQSATSPSRASFLRWAIAVLFLGLIGLLWWALASAPTYGNVFGLYSPRKFIFLIAASYALVWGIYFLLGRETPLKKMAKCVLTTISFLILFAMLEAPAVLGLIDYSKIISPPAEINITRIKPWDNPANILDKELMHIHPPNRRIVGETTGDIVPWLGIPTDRRYQIDVQYDSNGFRNDHDIEQAPLVVIGDSFIEGVLVPQADLVSSRLSRLLGTEVANLGQSGYGPQQELATLRRYAVGLRPRVVLWFFFEGNDLLDVPRYEEFVRNWESISSRRDSWKQRSFVMNGLHTLAGFTSPTLQPNEVEARRRSCQIQTGPGGETETLYFAYPGVPLSEEELSSLATAQNCMLDARKVSRDNGARLVIIYVPNKFRVYCDSCNYTDDGYGKLWKPNDLPSRFETWCKLNEIEFLDLTPALKESASRGELVYFTDDGHWTPKGHEIVARTVSQLVTQNGWLETPR
jgi:hypothetical protein